MANEKPPDPKDYRNDEDDQRFLSDLVDWDWRIKSARRTERLSKDDQTIVE